MGLLKGVIIAIAAILAIVAIISFRNNDVVLMTQALSGMLFLGVVEIVLGIREQGESMLRISIGMILGGLVCFFIAPIPFLGIFIGPLLGGFVVALCAGFRAGWNLLPTTIVTMVFISAAKKTELVFFVFGKLLDALGSSDVLMNFSALMDTAGVMAILPIIMACIVLWIYLAVLCGIGALIGAFLHPRPVIPKHLKAAVEKLDEQYKKAETDGEKEKIKQQAKELPYKSKIKEDLNTARKTWANSSKSDIRKMAKKIKKRKGATPEDLERGLTSLLYDKIIPDIEEYGYYDHAEKDCKKAGINVPYSKSGWLGLIKTDLRQEISRIVEEWKKELGGEK